MAMKTSGDTMVCSFERNRFYTRYLAHIWIPLSVFCKKKYIS
jgi:hypothetical protein